MDFKNAKVPKMPGFRIGGGLITAGLLGSVGLYAALNSLYNVEGGHRAIVFNRIGGITNKLYSEVDVKLVFKEVSSKFLRRRIVEGGKRSDGRIPSGIRSINSQCGLLPRAHGSALFTRGETQALAVATLEDKQMAQRVDNLVDVDEFKRFYLQYTFPPSCVGEAGRVGAHSRREIGHGMLAERALEPVLPSEDDFPYTIRVESTITESNGSSSVARCWSSFAGIAMGLVLDTKEFGGDGTPLILSDITGGEDASGDMDFKVAGNENGVTAFQMDIKVAGITLSIMKQALLQAREGRKVILGEMSKCSPPPSKGLSKYAPLILVMKVLVDAECTHDGSIKHIRKFEKWGWDTLQQRVLDAQRNDMLTNLQLQLLANGFRLLKAGGSLVYSTCSLTVAQNEDVVEQFLSQNPCAKLKAIDGANIWPCKSGSISKTLRFDPSTSQTSGLFIAKFTKSAA